MAEKSVSLEMDGHIFHMLDSTIEYIDQEKKRIYKCIMSELEHDIEIYVDTQFSKDSNGEPKGSVDAEKFMAYCKRSSEDSTFKYFGNPKISEKFKSFDDKLSMTYNKFYEIYDLVKAFNELCGAENLKAEIDKKHGQDTIDENLIDPERFSTFKDDIRIAINEYNDSISNLLVFMDDEAIVYTVLSVADSGIADNYLLDLQRNIDSCNKSIITISEADDGVSIMRNGKSLYDPLTNLATFINLKFYEVKGSERSGKSIGSTDDSIYKAFYNLNLIGGIELQIHNAINNLGYDVIKSKKRFGKSKIKLSKR